MKIIAVSRHREQKILDPLKESDIDYACVTSNKNNLIRENVEVFFEIRRHLRSGNFDLILTDHADISGFITALLSLRYQVPLVVRLGGEVWKINNDKIEEAKRDQDAPKYVFLNVLRHMNKFIFNQADGFLTVSDNLREEVISKFNISRIKAPTINVPITNQFAQELNPTIIRDKYNIREDNIIITVTNLRFGDKYCGVSEIVSEISSYLADNKDTAWVIAGGGYYQSKLKEDIDRIVDDENIRERVYTLGHVDEIKNVYSIGDVFVYNSYLDGYPNVILESQMAGVPVVTTDQEGMSEQIDDFETGLFFSPNNPNNLNGKISTLLDNPEVREKMLKQARQKVQKDNSPSHIAEQLEEALSRIIP